MTQSMVNYNVDVFRDRGVGGWRQLYLLFLTRMQVDSLIDFGCGSPHFLTQLESIPRRIGVDGNSKYADEYHQAGIEFSQRDLDHGEPVRVDPVEAAICSDVFEHLLYPERTLLNITSVLTANGFLFSHVPNEFTLRKTIRIMLGKDIAIYNHPHCKEYDHPHLHRFTKIGYESFLKTHFKFNVFLTDLRYNRIAKVLKSLRIRVPFAIEMGPTFVSTNCPDRFKQLVEIKKELALR